ncbi:MAG: amylosucrase [Chloroflexota bacterium]
MPFSFDLNRETSRTLDRILPRLSEFFDQANVSEQERQLFLQRVQEHFPALFHLYHRLYHQQYDFFYYLEDLLKRIAGCWLERQPALRDLDTQREADPQWFLSNQMVGGVCYVDLFAGNLAGIREQIPYFKALGLTYLHLMPLFKAPQPENDGGYAVSSYREVDPRLGSMAELQNLAQALRHNGISLVLDLVFNHTSDEHKWAQRALAGDLAYQSFYYIFPDRQMPDAYERHLREIFPDEHPGAFTYRPEIDCWVWTTFHAYQWDLNYANPAVFNHMSEEMLFLANAGVEVLRLDAVAFIWKQMGTSCENLPEAHILIQAFNAVARIAAPALVFKSEAIVHPDDVVRYIAPGECQLSYNPLLMALLWSSLATREVSMLRQALEERFTIPPACAWVNYVRCHDDIGWTFSDEDAARLNIHGYDHRKFLNDFYTGRFPGSFARGLPFQENPKTGDCRISGTCASLAGLEKALKQETADEVDLAIRRILLIHGIILTIGGVPLIYLGDEIGTLNDYTYTQDAAKADDSRWTHRPSRNISETEKRGDITTVQGKIYQGLRRLIQLRKTQGAFCGSEMEVIPVQDNAILGFVRRHGTERVLVLANFSEEEQCVPANTLRIYGLNYAFTDLMRDTPLAFADVSLAPYELIAIKSKSNEATSKNGLDAPSDV